MSEPQPVRIQYEPHSEGQEAIHKSRARFRVLACGPRYGKSTLGCMEALLHALDCPDGLGWIVEPTFALSQYIWNELAPQFFVPELIIAKNKTERAITIRGGKKGHRVEFKSADDPDRLVQVKLDWLWVDEPQLMSEHVWQNSLRPRLIDKRAPAWFTGTCRPYSRWFHDLWLRGQDPLDEEVESWSFATWDNPTLPPDELEKIREKTPERILRSLYGAEWLPDQASVFRRVAECSTAEPQEPQAGRRYVIGADLGRLHDYSVQAVGLLPERDGEKLVQVAFDRYRRIDWGLQEERTELLAKRYNNAQIWLDATGLGDPQAERLRRRGLRVEGVKFTLPLKAQMVDNLSLMFEQGSIELLAEPVQKAELEGFEYMTLPSGNERFSAPSGQHDDCVTAAMLMAWGCVQRPRVRAERYAPFARY